MAYSCVRVQFEIGHEAILRSVKTPEGYSHDWEVFVRGVDNAEIHHFVEKVVFNLHETFPNPKRVIKDPPYIVKESGYAGFRFPIDIYFKTKEDSRKVRYYYDLSLESSGLKHSRAIKKAENFPNPSEDFRRKLIRGGGCGVGSESSKSNDKVVQDESKHGSSSRPKSIGGTENKKHKSKDSGKNEEAKPKNSFADLFGTPIKTGSQAAANKPLSKSSSETKIGPASHDKLAKESQGISKAPKQSPLKEKDRERENGSSKKEKDAEKSHKKEKETVKEKEVNNKEKDKEKDSKLKDKKKSKEKESHKNRDKSKEKKHNKKLDSPPLVKPPKEEAVSKKEPAIVEKEKLPSKSGAKVEKKEKEKRKEEREKSKEKHKESDKKEVKEKEKNEVKSEPVVEKKVEPKIEKKEVIVEVKEEKQKPKEEKKEKSTEKEREKDKHENSKHKHKHKKKERHKKHEEKEKHKKKHEKNDENKMQPKSVSPASVKSQHYQETSDKESESEESMKMVEEAGAGSDSEAETPPKIKQENRIEERHKKHDKKSKEEKEAKKRKKKIKEKEEPPEKLPKVEITRESSEEKKSVSRSPSPESKFTEDYVSQLRALQHKIMTLQDNDDLQRVVQVISETGQFEITQRTFDFDLCALDRSTVKRLQDMFIAASS